MTSLVLVIRQRCLSIFTGSDDGLTPNDEDPIAGIFIDDWHNMDGTAFIPAEFDDSGTDDYYLMAVLDGGSDPTPGDNRALFSGVFVSTDGEENQFLQIHGGAAGTVAVAPSGADLEVVYDFGGAVLTTTSVGSGDVSGVYVRRDMEVRDFISLSVSIAQSAFPLWRRRPRYDFRGSGRRLLSGRLDSYVFGFKGTDLGSHFIADDDGLDTLDFSDFGVNATVDLGISLSPNH